MRLVTRRMKLPPRPEGGCYGTDLLPVADAASIGAARFAPVADERCAARRCTSVNPSWRCDGCVVGVEDWSHDVRVATTDVAHRLSVERANRC